MKELKEGKGMFNTPAWEKEPRMISSVADRDTSTIDGFVKDARRNNPTTILPQPQVSTAQRPLNSITNDANLQQTISNAKFNNQARALRGMTRPNPLGFAGIGQNPNSGVDPWFNEGVHTTPDDPWTWGDTGSGLLGLGVVGGGLKAMHESYSGTKRRGQNKILENAVGRGHLRTEIPARPGEVSRGWFNPMRYTGRGQGTKSTGAPQYYSPEGVKLSPEQALDVARQSKADMKAERGPGILQRATSKVGDVVGGKKPPAPTPDLLLSPDKPISEMTMAQKNEFLKLNGEKGVRKHSDADKIFNRLGYDTGGIGSDAVEAPTPEAVEAKPEAKPRTLGSHGEAVLESKMRDLSREPGVTPEQVETRRTQMREALMAEGARNPEQTRRFLELEFLEVNPGRLAEQMTTNADGTPKLTTDETTGKEREFTREEKVRIAQQMQTRNEMLKDTNARDITADQLAEQNRKMEETRRIVDEATLRPSENISDSTIKPGEPDWKMGERGRILYNTDMGYVEFKDLSLAEMNEMNQKRFGGERPGGKGTETPTSRSYTDAIRKWVTMNRDFGQVDLMEQNRRLKNLGAKKFDYVRSTDAEKSFNKIELELKAQAVKDASAREARMAKNKGGGSIRMGSGLGGATPELVTRTAKVGGTGLKAAGMLGGGLWGANASTDAVTDMWSQSQQPGGLGAGMGEPDAMGNATVDAMLHATQSGLGMGDFLTSLLNPSGPTGWAGPVDAAYAALPGQAAGLSNRWFGTDLPETIGPPGAEAGEGLISKYAPHLFQDINPEMAPRLRAQFEGQRRAQMEAQHFGGSSRWR